MLLTDEEARKEVCPLKRYCVNEANVLQNGDAPIYMHEPCQGSECRIGWRWGGDTDFLEVDEPAKGYCGAFGVPGVVR